MKKILFIIFVILVFVILAFAFNKYENNKLIQVDETKNVSDDNLMLEENININKALSNETTDKNTNKEDINEKVSQNENNLENKDNKDNKENKEYKENKENKENEVKKVKEKKKTIVIDPGHQARGDSSKEPIGPGASETKAKVTTGATGIYTKQQESELALKVALLLEKELKQEGYNVIMTRKTNNINISNSQRAKIANNAKADAFIRIHADSYDNSEVNRSIYIMPDF
ncbi:MAG: N-acetylmuramoyl-L-alanine amidase [Clostridia bacterium]|nr:N-acetylmuramoyl-L-alanine amidase [Clostridia bacterium]